MSQNYWININPARFFDLEEVDRVDGLDITIHCSPYEAPRQVAGCYDKEHNEYSILFAYMDDEEDTVEKPVGHVRVFEGKQSGRICRIAVPVDKLPTDASAVVKMQITIQEALDERLPNLRDKIGRRLNQKAANKVLKDNLGKLLQAGAH